MKNSNHNHCCHLPYPRRLPTAHTYKLQRGYNPLQFFLMPQCPCLCRLSWSPAGHALLPQTRFSSPSSLQRKRSALPKFQSGLDDLILLASSALQKVVIPATTWPQTLLKIFQAGQGQACPAWWSLGWIAGVQKCSLRVRLTNDWVVPESAESSSPHLTNIAGNRLGHTAVVWLCNTLMRVSYSSRSLMRAGGGYSTCKLQRI